MFNNAGGGGTITGCKILGSGIGPGGGHGIHMVNAAVQEYVISGNLILDNGKATKGYGIVVEAGVNNYAITGNVARGNAQGHILDQGASNKVLADNLCS